MVSCKELRSRAWSRLKGNYWSSFAASVLGSIIAGVFPIITFGPTTVGVSEYFLRQQRGEKVDLDCMFNGYTNNFVDNLLAGFLQMLFETLWSLLLIIPGIVYACATAVFGFYRYEHSDVNAYESLGKTKEFMKGYKWKFFCLNLSFIGWYLLCILTCGIGFLFIAPYVDATMAEFYAELKKEHGETEVVDNAADDTNTDNVFDA